MSEQTFINPAGVHDPNSDGPYFLEWEAPSPLARRDDPGVWRVRDSHGRHGDPWDQPVVFRHRSWVVANALCEARNAAEAGDPLMAWAVSPHRKTHCMHGIPFADWCDVCGEPPF